MQYRSVNAKIRDIQKLDKTNSENKTDKPNSDSSKRLDKKKFKKYRIMQE